MRSLVSKEFYYFLINILILLALGKAALSAVVEQIRACQWHATPDACELKFIKILGERYVLHFSNPKTVRPDCLLIHITKD